MELIWFIFLGLASGFFAGLLGLGGGIITVPVLALLIFPYLNFPSDEIMHIAVASSLAAMIPTSIMSIYGHHRQKGILWSIAFKFTPGLIVGGVIGAILASIIARQSLQYSFATFQIFVVAYMLFSSVTSVKSIVGNQTVNPYISLPISCLSSLLGVGGGTMTVPYLLWRGLEMRQAIGISAYCGFPIAIASTFTYSLMQYNDLNDFFGEFIYLPSVVGIGLGSILSAPLGAKCVSYLPVNFIKLLFSMMILLVSAKFFMLW